MKIGDLAKRTGLTTHTIRFYERIGLLPPAARGPSTNRAYDTSILPWIAFLGRLKRTGMPIREMVRYAALRDSGVATGAERRDLLVQHRARVAAHMADLQACLSALDLKIAGYDSPNTVEQTHDRDAEIPRRPLRERLARAR